MLWDVTVTAVPHLITAVTLYAYPRGVAFSETGDTLITYDEYGNVVSWDIAPLRAAVTDPVARTCRLARAEWSVMAPGVTFDRVCPSLPEAPPPPFLPIPFQPSPVRAGNCNGPDILRMHAILPARSGHALCPHDPENKLCRGFYRRHAQDRN
ncbi:hypothetical protein [Candidatus Protofrankia californiensis]|uniref:hypothetical protein n=1 Tax=Candidatus Protofrankia californiensis TaxID=1839754 RepID=UPI001041AE01|nr:hypothetical protein [Candidatus Protofrankia californiensis]